MNVVKLFKCLKIALKCVCIIDLGYTYFLCIFFFILWQSKFLLLIKSFNNGFHVVLFEWFYNVYNVYIVYIVYELRVQYPHGYSIHFPGFNFSPNKLYNQSSLWVGQFLFSSLFLKCKSRKEMSNRDAVIGMFIVVHCRNFDHVKPKPICLGTFSCPSTNHDIKTNITEFMMFAYLFFTFHTRLIAYDNSHHRFSLIYLVIKRFNIKIWNGAVPY